MFNLSIGTIKKYSLSEYKHYFICWKDGTENQKFSIIIWETVDFQKDVPQHQLHTPCTFFNSLAVNFISWETYMQVRKQQLELDVEQQTGFK